MANLAGGRNLACALLPNSCRCAATTVSHGFLASASNAEALFGVRSGKCGNVCPTDPNAIVSCLNGRCSFACTGSYTQCINANGQQFCADLQQDNNNCGALPSTASWAVAAGRACQAPLQDGCGVCCMRWVYERAERHLRSSSPCPMTQAVMKGFVRTPCRRPALRWWELCLNRVACDKAEHALQSHLGPVFACRHVQLCMLRRLELRVRRVHKCTGGSTESAEGAGRAAIHASPARGGCRDMMCREPDGSSWASLVSAHAS